MICINPVSVCFYFILPHSMWDLSSAAPKKKRWNPHHLHWKCQVLTTEPPGMSLYVILVHHIILLKMGKIDDTGVIQIAHIETILLIWNDVHGILKSNQQGTESRVWYAAICVKFENLCICICVFSLLNISGRIPKKVVTLNCLWEGEQGG